MFHILCYACENFPCPIELHFSKNFPFALEFFLSILFILFFYFFFVRKILIYYLWCFMLYMLHDIQVLYSTICPTQTTHLDNNNKKNCTKKCKKSIIQYILGKHNITTLAMSYNLAE